MVHLGVLRACDDERHVFFYFFLFFCKGVEQNMAFLCGFFISSCLFNNYTSRISFIRFFPAFNLLGVLRTCYVSLLDAYFSCHIE